MALSTLVMVGETKEWESEIAERAKALKTDGGFEEGADLGPVISPQSKQRIEELIASAEQEGATILLDGRGYKPAKYPNGNWVSVLQVYCKNQVSRNANLVSTGRPNHYHRRETAYEVLP
jgi:acyl-CoA reductase-like NAD-dependent aldehyde dehydrogenase